MYIYIYTHIHIHASEVLENALEHPSGRDSTRRVPTVRFVHGGVWGVLPLGLKVSGDGLGSVLAGLG